jgi:redox-sensitive bicupin YhaK (pirin superfamily)
LIRRQEVTVSEQVPARIDVRRGVDRFETRIDWLVSRHSFSYGPHYDPANTRFGALVSSNDDVLAVGAGFPEHPHRDLEIVSWVVEGALEHSDSSGGAGVLRPGMVGRLSTGSGVRHVEANVASGPTRYVQMWLLPDADGPASYVTADVSPALAGGGLVTVASGERPAPVGLRCKATLLVGRLPAGASVALPLADLLHVFVATGSVSMPGVAELLGDGDAVRITGPCTADLTAAADAEVLVWSLPAASFAD